MPDQTRIAPERRRIPRDVVETDVHLSNGFRNIVCRVRDISAGGAALQWLDGLESPEHAVPIDHLVQLSFRPGLIVRGFVTSIADDIVHVTFDIDDVELSVLVDDLRDATGAALQTA